MSVLERWLARDLQLSQLSQLSQPPHRGTDAVREREEEENLNSSREEVPAKPAKVAKVPRWSERPDVVVVVEDLADEGKKPGQISRLLGLTRAEVVTVLRRTRR